MPELEVIRSAGAAHPGRYPAGVDGVDDAVRPSLRERDSKRDDEELAVAVRLDAAPLALGPVDVAQRCVAGSVHVAAQVHEPRRTLDPCGQQVRGEDVD